MKYKVSFSGFHYVEADSPEEAKLKAECEETVYSESQVDSVEQVEGFYAWFRR